MKDPVVLIGVGEMGGVFARGLLRAGHPLYPLNRGDDADALAAELPQPALVLLAVAESACCRTSCCPETGSATASSSRR